MHTEDDSRQNETAVELPKESILRKHISLGFRDQDIQYALNLLQQGTPFAKSLLAQGDPDHACLEILLLLVPECRLPKHFLDQKKSAPFISSVHRSDEDVKSRWLQNIAVQQGGWPASFVSACLNKMKSYELSDIIKLLNCALDENTNLVQEETEIAHAKTAAEERATEVSAIESIFEGTKQTLEGSTQVLKIPLNTSIVLHLCVCFGPDELYPLGHSTPPMYIESLQVPAFHRLHLLRYLLANLKRKRQDGEPILLDAVQELESEWQRMQAQVPNLSDIINIFQQTTISGFENDPLSNDLEISDASIPDQQQKRTSKGRGFDSRNDAQVLSDYIDMHSKEGYLSLLKTRDALPAYNCRKELVGEVNKSRVIIVVGDTGQ